MRGPPALATLAGLGAIVGLAVAAPIYGPGLIFSRAPPTIAVTAIVGAGNDPQAAQMAANVTDRLTDGLAKIGNIRVVALQSGTAPTSPELVSARSAQADFVVSGELQASARSWEVQARMTSTATGEVRWTTSLAVDRVGQDSLLQQSRLAAGLGHPLALRINALLNSRARSAAIDSGLSAGDAKVVIEQAMAFINQTTPERFQAAQAMLEKPSRPTPTMSTSKRRLPRICCAAFSRRGIIRLMSPRQSAAPSRCWSARCRRSRPIFPCSKGIAASLPRPTISSKAS